VPAGSTIVSGQNTNTIVVNFGTTTGKVGVTAKNACGNRGTTTLSITFNCRLSLATAFSISANPNPSSGKTEIVIDGTISENSSLIVTNVLGKDVYTQKVNTSAGNVIPLDLTGFAKGIYLITLQSGEMKKSIRLVVN
jgi:hypothetical protein